MPLLRLTISAPLSKGDKVEEIHQAAESAGLTAKLSFDDTADQGGFLERMEELLKERLDSVSSDMSVVSEMLLELVGKEAPSDAPQETLSPADVDSEPTSSANVQVQLQEEETPAATEPKGGWYTVRRFADDNRSPCLVEDRNGDLFLTLEGVCEVTGAGLQTIQKFLGQAEADPYEVKVTDISEKVEVWDPQEVLPYLSKKRKIGLPRMLGADSVSEAMDRYYSGEVIYRAPLSPAKSKKARKAKKGVGKLTNNSTVSETVAVAKKVCKVSAAKKGVIKFDHPSWPRPLTLATNAKHCTEQLFKRINKLLP